MKKRVLCLLLAAVLAVTCLPTVRAAETMTFVAVNDTIPTNLIGEPPYYAGGTLYIPFTAYDANPGGVVVSNNVDKRTLVLFTAVRRLVYDLDANTVTDEKDNVSSVTLTSRGGVLFLPASSASHFGLSVNLLYSKDGYPILRFTNGNQVYDDSLFVEKAENLIRYITENYQEPQDIPAEEKPTGGQEPPVVEPPPETEPATVYLALAGDAVSEETLALLEEHAVRAAFFLTAEQLRAQPELARRIYAAGHTIGLAAAEGRTDTDEALREANEALDQVLFFKSVFALVPAALGGDGTRYRILTEPEQPLTAEEAAASADAPQLLVCRSDAAAAIETLLAAEAVLPQLLETTELP